MSNVIVTVCLITYNHSKFIREAIESILMQEAEFEWDVVIADDFSTDGTREILKEYKEKYPQKINLILQKQNVGLQQNFVDLFTWPSSKYIAFLDGDDKWVDPLRLQKQVDFLEHHQEYAMVYGKYNLMNEEGGAIPLRKLPPYKSGYIFKEILLRKFLPPMAAALMRNDEIQKIYTNKTEPGIDFYLIASLAKNNKVAFLDEPFFTYRINSSSITSTQNEHMVSLFKAILETYKDEYPALVKKGLSNGNRMFLYLIADKNPSWSNFKKLLKNFNFSFLYFRQLFKCGIRMIKHSISKKNQ